MKTKSKYILLVFVGIIIMLLGGIFLTIPQEKDGPVTAEAFSEWWGGYAKRLPRMWREAHQWYGKLFRWNSFLYAGVGVHLYIQPFI